MHKIGTPECIASKMPSRPQCEIKSTVFGWAVTEMAMSYTVRSNFDLNNNEELTFLN